MELLVSRSIWGVKETSFTASYSTTCSIWQGVHLDHRCVTGRHRGCSEPGIWGSEDASDVCQSEINSSRYKILYYWTRVFSISVGSEAARSIFVWKGICVRNWSPTIVILESFQDQQWPHYEVGSVFADLPVPGPGGQGFWQCHCGFSEPLWYMNSHGYLVRLMKLAEAGCRYSCKYW